MRATVEGKRNSPVGNWSRNCPFENSIVFLWVEENNRFSLMMAVFESNAFQRLFLFGKFWKEESFIISLLRNYSRWNWISIRNSVFRTIIPIIYFFKERKLYRIRIDKFFPKFNIPFKKKKNGNSNKILVQSSLHRLKFPNFPKRNTAYTGYPRKLSLDY